MTWNDQHLDALRDGSLGTEQARALNEDLLTDPALRTRWSNLARADARAGAIFAGSTPVRRLATGRIAAVAALALAGVVAVWMRPMPAQSGSPLVHTEQTPTTPGDQSGGPRLRVLAEFAAPARMRPVAPAQPAEVATAASVDLRRLGEALRSATEARETLARLPLEQQLDACEQWAADPRLRPAAFEHLRALRASGTAGASEVADSLARRPELRGWLASYGLASPAPAPLRVQ